MRRGYYSLAVFCLVPTAVLAADEATAPRQIDGAESVLAIGTKQVKLQSWHEQFEADGKTVAGSHAVSGLDGKSRLELLSMGLAAYLYNRFVGCETRGRAFDIIPAVGQKRGEARN